MSAQPQPAQPHSHFQHAYAAFQAKQFAEMEQALVAGRESAPDSAHILRLQSLLAYGRGEWVSAEKQTRLWAEQDTQDSQPFFILADILTKQGRAEEAKDALRQAAKLAPDSKATALLQHQAQRQNNLIGGLLLFCALFAFILGIGFLIAYFYGGEGIYMPIIAVPTLAGGWFLGWAFFKSRQAVSLQVESLIIGRGDSTNVIPYDEVISLRNGQLGILLRTNSKRYRIYLINQSEQAKLFVELRNRVPKTQQQLLIQAQKQLPTTIKGNWHTHLTMWFLLGVGLLNGFVVYYNAVIEGDRNWVLIIVLSGSAVFVTLLSIWVILTTPIRVRFSAETITIRTLIKATHYPVINLRYIGLRKGYRTYRGQQMPNYEIELHFATDQIVKLGEHHIPHPAGDWSPLYALTTHLQTQYGVNAPPDMTNTVL